MFITRTLLHSCCLIQFTSLIAQLQMNIGPVYSKKKKRQKKQRRSYTAMYICSSFLKLTSINMFLQKPHLSKLKEGYSTYLFSQSLIILKMKTSLKKRLWLQIDVGKNKVLFLSFQLLHVISIFVVIERMKRVWKPRSEIRAKTAKTRVLGSSLSRPSAAILVSERSDRSRSSLSIFFLFDRLN